MSNPITPLDSFWASLEQLALLVEDFPHFSENPPSLPPRATTAHPRRTRPIEKIDWEKYSDGLLNEYALLKSLFFQGVEAQTRKIQDLTSLQQSFLKLRELIEKHWSELTSYDKRTLEFVAQEILKSFALLGFEKSAHPPKFLTRRIVRVLFSPMRQKAGDISSSSKPSVKAMRDLANCLQAFCHEIVRLAQEERQGQEPPFYETATHEEWSKAWEEWSASHVHKGPPLSAEAVSRESLYEDSV